MSIRRVFSIRAAAGALALCTALPIAAAERAHGVPVLAELFTSEGCSSCPPADALLARLDQQSSPGSTVIVLSEHVDYWNRIGWTDPFSSPQFSARQAGYERRFHLDSSYTPQLVIDGHAQFAGGDARAIQSALLRAAATPKLPLHIVSAERDGEDIAVRLEMERVPESSSFKRGEVWIALASDKEISNVRRGENSGRTLTHVAVVRSLTKVGVVTMNDNFTKSVRLPYDWRGKDMRVIALLQQPGFGEVMGADLVLLPASR